MIIKINVVPEYKDEANPKDLIPVVLSVAVVSVGAYYLPTLYADTITAEAREIESKTAQKREELSKLQVDLNRAKVLQAALNDIKSRQTVVKSLTQGRKQPIAILEYLQDIHLDRMWLSELSFTSNVVNTKGWAADHAVIAEYVRRIKVTNGKNADEAIDAKEFTPVFDDPSTEKKEKKELGLSSTAPVIFSNVNLKDSIYQEDQTRKMPIQQFEIEFNANIDGGSAP
jgi:Tfp pilus assembly protein PilN